MPANYFDDSTLVKRHYFVAGVIFLFYGVQVCPFIESLSLTQYLIEVGILFTAAYFARKYLMHQALLTATSNHVSAEFKHGLTVFASIAVIQCLFNAITFGFPFESGLKTSVGMLSFGFFISAHLALKRELALAKWCNANAINLPLKKNYFSLTRKFETFSTALIVWSVAILFLVFVKDLDWLLAAGSSVEPQLAQRYILIEIVFVAAFLLGYALLIVRSYAENIEFFLEQENSILHAVQQGQRETRVAITSNDEFGRMASYTNHMIETLQQREQELNQTRDVTILALASLAETRDNETGAHIVRTQFYVKALAEDLRTQERYARYLDDTTIDLLFKSAPLHDIGKVGIPDAVLLKPGKLNNEEFEIIKQHPMIGSQALAQAEEALGSTSFLRFAREISETHHEKWDGSGYPLGLREYEIPLSGRLMALADVYDALISKRVYKPAFSHEKAKEIILEGNGTHFDPEIIAAFLRCEQSFKDIAAKHQDKSCLAAA